MKNIYKFKRNVEIGNLAAEDDDFLLRAFVQKGDLEILRDVENNRSIILGRTGIGKSALIRYIVENEPDVVRIEPETMSLRHLSNSTIIKYFQALDVKLDLFYKVLWRHVFIVEFIKMRFHGNSKSDRIIDWLYEKFKGDRRKAKALNYLEKWEHHFWETTEHQIKEIEQGLEDRYSKELAANVSAYEIFKASGRFEHESSSTKNIKSELIHKAQKVVNETQIEEIREIINIMSTDLFSKTQKKYFIVIDDLDKDWVDDSIVYELIKALIEVINEFRTVKPAKVVISLRSNILKRVFYKNLSRGIQREKHNHLYLQIAWSKEELKELLDKRLKELMRGQYTKDYPTTKDIFPDANSRNEDGFSYILDRTLMRPRDVIDFFNKCIKNADSKTTISREIIRMSEDEYSHERLQALNDEWNENFGSLDVLYSFLKGYYYKFKISDIEDSAKEHLIDQISNDEHKYLNSELKDDFEDNGNSFEIQPILKKILSILFEIGILGIKLNSESPILYSHMSYSQIQHEDIHTGTSFYVHKMFHKALKIKEKK